jgi:signal transduction histidine kinase/FixJ family two-component response regulator
MSLARDARILVVDDDRGLLQLVEQALLRDGISSAVVFSGGAALQWLAEKTPDLLLLDLNVGEIQAPQLLDQLAACGRAVPFIIMTGHGSERMAVEMMKRGALDYLVKDDNFLGLLRAAVKEALAHIGHHKGITNAERTLRQDDGRFRSTLDNMMEGCQTLGFDWRYLYLNAAAARHGRRSAKDLLGRTLMEAYPGIEKTAIFAQLQECMTKRVRSQLENEFTYDDGETAWFELLIQPVPEGLFILSLDITKRKDSEFRRKLQYETAVILSQSHSVQEAMQRFLSAVCQTFRWTLGELWAVDPSAGLTRIAQTSTSDLPSALCHEFSAEQAFTQGRGLAGRVWASAAPAYIPRLEEDQNFARPKVARKLGLRSAFAFPITLRGQVLGVMCFFGNGLRQPDEDLLSCFAVLGSQLGQFFERKQLEREILETSHHEQNRLGRDLHDGLGQQLTALEFFTVGLAGELQPTSPKLARSVREMAAHVREALQQTRALAHGLSPLSLSQDGLSTALRELAEMTRKVAKVDCQFLYPAPLDIPEAPGTQLYRIAQETINNALRHGGATRIRISLKANDGHIQLSMADNGRGFSTARAGEGLGLRAMQYRADLIGADLRIDSAPGKGTCITCTLRKTAAIAYQK